VPREAAARPLAALAAAAAAGLLATAAGMLPAFARLGAFARVAATALAAGLPLLVGAHLPGVPVGAYVWVAAAAVVLALAAAPLRERGLWSLGLASGVDALPTLFALRQARWQARAALPVHAVQAATAPEICGADQVSLLLDEHLDPALVRALPLALRPPFVATARDVLAAPRDSLAARWLLGMELPAFVLSGVVCEPAAPPPKPSRLGRGSLAVQAGFDRDAGGATGLWIRCAGVDAGLAAVVYTPVGAETLPLSDPARGIPEAEQRRLGRWLRPLPPGLRIRVLVVAPATADAYGWTELRT
jgi:hypothetical protein